MGVRGDSVTIAPARRSRTPSTRAPRPGHPVIRAVRVETGGSNIQFAVSPETGEWP